MLYDLSDPRDMLEFQTAVNEAIQFHKKVSLTRVKKSRTYRQNSYLHFLCDYFATQYGCTKSEAKEVYLKRYACPDIFAVQKLNPKGQLITTYRSTADLNIEEESSAIRNFIEWAALGDIELPLPTDTGFRRYAERQIEKNQSMI